MLMESDPNPIPKLEIFSPVAKLCKIAHFLLDHITSEGLSDHANTGGGPALDRQLNPMPGEIGGVETHPTLF